MYEKVVKIELYNLKEKVLKEFLCTEGKSVCVCVCMYVIVSTFELEFELCSCFSQPAFVWYPLESWLQTLAQIQDRKSTDKIKV